MRTPLDNKKSEVGSRKSAFYFHPFRLSLFTFHFSLFTFSILLLLSGCATTEDTTRLSKDITSTYNEFYEFKNEIDTKLLKITKDQESIRKQLLNLSSSVENRDDKIRTMDGRLAELDYQIQTYWKDVKAEMASLKAGSKKPQTTGQEIQTQLQLNNTKYETVYKEAFEAYQKGSFDAAIKRFSDYIANYPDTPVTSNAHYWLGESYMSLKDYEKAIIHFQEVIVKYPKSDKASRALLSQAEAFGSVKDEKSSITILKKVIELYPNTGEAAIAERKLRNLGYR